LVSYKLLPNNRLLGPKFGRLFPTVRNALISLDAAQAAVDLQKNGKLILQLEDRTVELSSEEVLIQTESRGGLAVSSDRGITVAIDTTLTPELLQEGYARDLVRAINTMRKDAGLALDDRIHLTYEASGEVEAALSNFEAYIKQETLALSLSTQEHDPVEYRQVLVIDGHEAQIGLRKAER